MINLMDALERSLARPVKAESGRQEATGQSSGSKTKSKRKAAS